MINSKSAISHQPHLPRAAGAMPVSAITRDGLLINDQPLYLLSGVIHFFRWPKAEWRDILLKAKAGGLNTIDTVIPWNL
ncbi:MAG TPA: beta-galactosidase, partial [Anaerolineae bacterium]